MIQKTIENGKVKLIHGSGHVVIYDKEHYERLRERFKVDEVKTQANIFEVDETIEQIDNSMK